MPVCKHDISIEGEKVWLCVSYGEVMDQQKWAETHVNGSGNQYRTDVSSTVHEKLEFWIREKDGREERIQLSNANFGVRPGQKVWVAWGGGKKRKEGSYLRASNLVANTTINLKNWHVWWNSEVYSQPFFPIYLKHLVAWGVILIAALYAVAGMPRDPFVVGLGGGLVPALISSLIAIAIKVKGRLPSIDSQLEQAINNLVSEEALVYTAAAKTSQNAQPA